MTMSKTFRERNLTKIAMFTLLGTLCAILVSFQLAKVPWIAGPTYHAQFAEAGGLKVGDPVEVAGVSVGKVTALELDGAMVDAQFTAKGVDLGSDTTARIKTATLLGSRFIELEPRGGGALPSKTIRLKNTAAPYDLASSLSELTERTRALDVDQVSQALDVVSETIDSSAAEIAPAIKGVSDLSKTISTRDTQLRQLFASAREVTGTFRERTDQVQSLIAQGNLLLQELIARREAIEELIRSANAVAVQVSGLVDDNAKQLKPALQELNATLALLRENNKNITVAVSRAANFITGLGEGLSHGTWFAGFAGIPPPVVGVQQFAPGLGADLFAPLGGNQ
jgi:phospholipid/cholesterol/gamma-HCH transport system substrate-binding protein